MLVKQVAGEFGGRVRVVVEEYGNSPTADRFGVRRYPAVFVDDILLARPKDFGFGGAEDISGGLYVPWRDPDNQRRFAADLRRAVTRRLAGETVGGHALSDVTTPDSLEGPPLLPELSLNTIDGRRVDGASLQGQVVVVELWATWCPPCRSTLEHLNTVNGNGVRVVAIAVDSNEADVKKMAEAVKASYDVVFGTAEIVDSFGAVAAVPKVLVFDRRGRLRSVIHGAPPDLHERLGAAIRSAR